MPDREPGRDNTHELEHELRELGARIEYPPTPDLSRAVRRQLDEVEARNTSRARRFWAALPTLRWAAAALFVLVIAVPTLSPGLRATVAGWLVTGQAASTGQEDKAAGGAGRAAESGAPESPAGEVFRPSSGGSIRPLGEDQGFGDRITLQEADPPVPLPRAPKLGKPDEVYSGEGGLTLVYRARAGLPSLADSRIGLLLTQLSGGLEATYLAEEPASGTKLEEVRVHDERGYWFPDGRRVRSQPGDAERLPGGALLWERKGRAFLMRAELSKEETIRIAESVR